MNKIPSDVDEFYKYVRLDDGTFEFAPILSLQDHASLVPEGRRAVSAGAIGVWDGKITFRSYGSESLRLGWDKADWNLLPAAVNMKVFDSKGSE